MCVRRFLLWYLGALSFALASCSSKPGDVKAPGGEQGEPPKNKIKETPEAPLGPQLKLQ
jgi:hypothetical protein